MIWQEWITAISSWIGMDVTLTALTVGIMFLLGFLFLALLITNGKGNTSTLFIGLFLTCFFTALGWFPYWIILIVTLIVVGMFSKKIMKLFGGD